MVAVRLPEEIEARLAHIAQLTGRTKTFYVREAILQHLDDLENICLAITSAKGYCQWQGKNA